MELKIRNGEAFSQLIDLPGPKGPVGIAPAGPQGEIGPAGPTGATGATGPTGLTSIARVAEEEIESNGFWRVKMGAYVREDGEEIPTSDGNELDPDDSGEIYTNSGFFAECCEPQVDAFKEKFSHTAFIRLISYFGNAACVNLINLANDAREKRLFYRFRFLVHNVIRDNAWLLWKSGDTQAATGVHKVMKIKAPDVSNMAIDIWSDGVAKTFSPVFYIFPDGAVCCEGKE